MTRAPERGQRSADLSSQKILRALEDQDTSVMFDDPLEHDMVLNMGPQHPATHGVLRFSCASTAKRSSRRFPTSDTSTAGMKSSPGTSRTTSIFRTPTRSTNSPRSPTNAPTSV